MHLGLQPSVGRISGQRADRCPQRIGTGRETDLGHRHAYAGGGKSHRCLNVVLQMLADIGEVEAAGDTGGLDLAARADPR